FTPCTLTILGVIMFLRFGQVVGNAGIWYGLLIVLMSKTVTTLTALSLSAVATNTRVKGGGAYFLISRSLGVEFGGAIGMVFYLSQAISVAMYVIGFTEALTAVAPLLEHHFRLTASMVNIAVFVCVFIGAGWTIKVQYGILALLFCAIVSFVLGAIGHWDTAQLTANLKPAYSEGQSLWTMFALFFPAATGIMAGANMSGDLENPARSIPRGTLWAIGTTALIYAGFAVLLGSSSSRQSLLTNNMIVADRALSSLLITLGVFAATLSSALGSLMGAPRILQALARDRIFPFLRIFIPGSGPSDEPRRATIISFIIAELGILFGDLNAIAPIITMFFMITYGSLNFAAFQEGVSGNPSYRPTFRFCHWSISLAGAIACSIAMLLIDPVWAVGATLVMIAIYRYLKKQEIRSSWGDLHSGATLERVRRGLLRLEQESYHPKNWRPTILALGMHKEERLALAVMAKWLSGYNGLLLLGQVITSDDQDVPDRHARARRMLRKRIAEFDLDAFPAVTIDSDYTSGILSLVQCSGVGAIRPNLVLFNWPDNPAEHETLLDHMSRISQLGRSVAVLRYQKLPEEDIWEIPPGPIDVWWLGMGNGTLMLLLAHLLRHNQGWRNHTIRLIRMIADEAGCDETRLYLDELAHEARITVESLVIVGENFQEILPQTSRQAALCILGMNNPQELNDDFFTKMDSLTQQLPRILLVHSAGDMSLEV
ncbi:MAG: hypothetical protein JW860_02190, partial [Sedimentisphaerales bacterium]|nr:hypothetical protein [Sedimentisphaerales bacterium]